MRLLALPLAAALAGAAFAQNFPPRGEVPPRPADALYYNGNVITMWPEQPVVEAIAVADGRILAIGGSRELGPTVGPRTRQIDLQGLTVLPGLIDSHVHPIGAALAEKDAEIPVMHSFDELREHVERQLEKGGEGVISVPKVYSTRLAERRYPTRWEIDAYSGDRPVVFDNGYAAALNSAALAEAGITGATPEPDNGKIIRNDEGEPTGLILGARQLVSPLLRSTTTTFEDRLEALKRMQKAYNAVGLTSVIDRSLDAEGVRVYQTLWEQGKLSLRTYLTRTVNAERPMEEIEEEIEALGPVTGFGDEMLRMGSLKIFLDGGILIGTAYLREPYGEHTEVYGFDDPDYRGVLRVPPERIEGIAKLCSRLGWQMTAHTTGGASSDALLDAYEAVDRVESIRDKRFTMTHVNFPNEQAIERAKRLGVLMDIQPAWHHFDGPALSKVLGPERMKFFQPLESIFDAGVIVAGGSDHMIKFDSREAINPYNPFFGMWMTITRQGADGRVYNPEQRLSREQALKMWTWNAAYLSFDEDVKGSLEPGKYADFTVIDRDFLTCPEEEIRNIEALATVIGGNVVFRAEGAPKSLN